MTTLVTGGAASGKSEYAERLAEEAMAAAGTRGLYLATMSAKDPESLARIEKHRARRAGRNYETRETPRAMDLKDFAIQIAGEAENTVLLLDDLGNLVANELFDGTDPAAASRLLTDGERMSLVETLAAPLEQLARTAGTLVLVSVDVFRAPYPTSDPGTENYLRVLADLHRTVAAFADRVCEVTAGLATDYKGGTCE